MEEAYLGIGRVAQPSETETPTTHGTHLTGWMTVQDAIRLTDCFEREWFRSLDTLEADLARFATAYRLSTEEAHQVRRAVEALHDGDGGRRLE